MNFLYLPTQAIARACQVYVYDQRFHGQSDKPAWVRLACIAIV